MTSTALFGILLKYAPFFLMYSLYCFGEAVRFMMPNTYLKSESIFWMSSSGISRMHPIWTG